MHEKKLISSLLSTLVVMAMGVLDAGCNHQSISHGRDVSNRCCLAESRTLASWENDADGFIAADSCAIVRIADESTHPYSGEHCLEVIYPAGERASRWRTICKDFISPIDLTLTPMIEYGLLVAEGPGREFKTRLTLRASDGREFSGVANIIPTLWQGVIFDMHECPFMDDVAAIEIAVMNNSEEPWNSTEWMVDGLSVGKPLDLDFEVAGSESQLKPVGNPSVSRSDGNVMIDFKAGDAVEVLTYGSRNSIYNPFLEQRNTVELALMNKSDADSLRLNFITENDSSFTLSKSKTVRMPKVDGWQRIQFNLSDIPMAKGRLTGLRIEPLGEGGRIILDRISFEREPDIVPKAGSVTFCEATESGVTVKGIVEETFVKEGVNIEIRHYPLWKSELPFDSLELIATCVPVRDFVISGIPNIRHDGRMTHLSSRFMAAIRLKDGNMVKVGEPFFISNWRDFIDNPYEFELSGNEYSVLDYGALGDGVTNDNSAIQMAIDDAAYRGGGKVVLNGDSDAGSGREYIATNLELRSGVNLVIERGAILRQSPKFGHYAEYPPEYGHDNVIPGVPWTHCMYTNRPLILAKDIENVKITGGGKIRMDDTASENPAWTHYARVCSDRIHIVPIAVCNTRHVEISDIDIVRCSNYHTIFYRADSVFVGNLKMHEVACLSGDGLSFGNAVTNVRVGRCVFESNDDGIVLCSSYKDPRGGAWRERIDSIDSSVRHIEVFSSYIDCARGGGGKAIALIPWGSTNPRQDFNEIDNIEVRDCVLRGGHSIGSWPDNPFDGKPFDNAEPDDYAPVKNLRIFDNEYLSPVELNGVVPTTLLSDCGLHGSHDFKNAGFIDRLAYWSKRGDVESQGPGKINLADGTIYQGLYLSPGRYMLSWTGIGEISPTIRDMYGSRIRVEADGSFTVELPQTVLVGLRGRAATVTSVKLDKRQK